MIAFFLSAYCKGVDLEADDVDQDENPPLLFPKSQWKGKKGVSGSNKKKKSRLTISEEQLDIAKNLRVKEKEMWCVSNRHDYEIKPHPLTQCFPFI